MGVGCPLQKNKLILKKKGNVAVTIVFSVQSSINSLVAITFGSVARHVAILPSRLAPVGSTFAGFFPYMFTSLSTSNSEMKLPYWKFPKFLVRIESA